MKTKYILMIFFALIVTNSYSQEIWNYIGKSKQEVINLIGEPNIVSSEKCLLYSTD
mgnify:CR=1 FL=1